MSMLNATELQRLRYRQGQLLRSSDFNDQLAIEAQLRWWHNRALHNAYGVALGFKVELDHPNDADWIIIESGVAYDCFGRELIHLREKKLPIPHVPSGEKLALLVRYRNTRSFPKRADIEEACLPEAGSLLEEQPEFCWKPFAKLNVRDGVLLGILEANEDKQQFTSVIQRSRPLARPRIGNGATPPGNTAWEEWREPENDGVSVGFQVQIDTSAAGFMELPCYFAWLQRSPQQPNGLQRTPQDQGAPDFLPLLEHIEKPSTNGFVFRVWMPSFASEEETAEPSFSKFLNFAQAQGLFVCWLGIQPVPGGSEQSELSEVNHGLS